MERKLGKMVLLTFCALLMGVVSLMAQTPQPTWIGVHSLAPKAMYWSGSCAYNGKIYVFGGNENDGETKTTYIYDIATDSWSQGADLPTGRYLCTAVEVGGKIYVMGGRQLTASTNPVNVNECYDPATNTWTTKAAMPKAIRGHAAVAANGKVYVLGGNTGTYTDVVSIYDPATNAWSNGPAMPAKAAYGGAVYSQSANAIFWVGGVKSSTAAESSYIGKAFTLTLSDNKWDAGVAMPIKTAYFGIATDDSKIYVSGGSYWESGLQTPRDFPFPGILVYDIAQKNFANYMIDTPSPWNRNNSLAVVAEGSLWLMQGDGNRLVDEYNLTSKQWYEPNPPLNDGQNIIDLAGATGGAINGKIYVVGGAVGSVNNPNVYEFDPSTNNWTMKTGTDSNPTYYCAGAVWNDKLVIYGGFDNNDDPVTQAKIYDPIAETFTPIGGTNPTHANFATGVVLNDKLYLFGGDDGTNMLNYVSILDLNSGTWSSGANLPIAMENMAATAYNGKIYLFGGYDNVEPDYHNPDTYIYDPGANTFTKGPALTNLTQVREARAFVYADYIFIDSGYDLYYNDLLGGLSGGPVADMQIFNPATNSFVGSVPRPFGRMGFVGSVIGTKYYAVVGDDGSWPCDRLDIASFGGGGCTVTCTASASPTTGAPPLTVTFTATANATGCTGTPTFAWNFGDGETSTDQNPTHTYQNEGTFNWNVTVTVDNQTCRKSGTITVGAAVCAVTCDASASPATGAVPLTVNFTGTETHNNCEGEPTFAWDFGDQETSTEQNPTHTYQSAGTYNWSFTVTVDGKPCTKTGTVTVTEVAPPTIASVKKATNPFRLIIMGTGFQNNCKVKINNVEVPTTAFKSSTKVVAKGKGLKNMVPKGQAVTITVVNPDGGVSNEYTYTR